MIETTSLLVESEAALVYLFFTIFNLAIHFHQPTTNLSTTAGILIASRHTMASASGTKRRNDSLFVGADEDFDEHDTISKPVHPFMLDRALLTFRSLQAR